MARRVVLQLVNDCGREIDDGAGGTVNFSLDQVDCEIDLSIQHRDELRAVLQPNIARAQKVRATGTCRRRK